MSNGFLDFVKAEWPEFIEGAIHRKMAAALDWVDAGECKRLIIAAPPRHAKSSLANLFARYYATRRASAGVLVCSAYAHEQSRKCAGLGMFVVRPGERIPCIAADLVVVDGCGDREFEGDHDREVWLDAVSHRLLPGGSVVAIDSRHGPCDFIGYMLRNPRYGAWDFLSLPAVGQSGKPSSDGYWAADELDAIRKALPRKDWQAQFQQNVCG